MNTIKVLKNTILNKQLLKLANENGIINYFSSINTFMFLTNKYPFSQKISKPNAVKITKDSKISQQEQQLTKQQVLKTYLQVIPPHRFQQILHPQKSDLSYFLQKPEESSLTLQQYQNLYKQIKKYVHTMRIEQLTQLLQVIQPKQGTSQECKHLSRKIYTKIMNIARKKLNILSIQQIVNFMYKLVKLNRKQYQFMKEVEKIILQQKIKINYPIIRKILWSFTHLDVGSSVLYSHISKTIKIGQHQLSPIQLAQSAYMLSKTSQNQTGGYGIYLIAEKHLLNHFPRLNFHQLVKASSYMLTQNIGTNDFQMQLQSQLYKKFPDRPSLRINDLVSLLKATSAYYFKYNDKALLNILQASTAKLAPDTNLEQFQDILWSWGRAGKGDKQLWKILQEQINKKFINLLKPRQVAFFYHALCNTEYSSDQTINNLQQKFMKILVQKQQLNEHYLLKFMLGMQKRKNYSSQSFSKLSKIVSDRLSQLSIKQLITFVRILNQSDLCYEDKQKFKQMELSLLNVCQATIAQKVYMFRINEIVQILYMWIKLDISGQSKSSQSQKSNKFIQALFSQIDKYIHQIPKSVFIKALFCFTIKDKYENAVDMVTIMQELLKYGQISYFFSPFQLPLAAYSVYHMVVNSNGQIKFKDELVQQLGNAIDNTNPVILNKFVRNGYTQCLKLKQKYNQMKPNINRAQDKKNKKKKRNN